MKNFRKAAIILLPILIAIVSVGLLFLSREIVRNREQNKDDLKQFEFSVNEDGLTLTRINYLEGNELILPEEYFDRKVTEIAVFGFEAAEQVEKLVVPASVKRIDTFDRGGYLSALKEVVFAENAQLEYIGQYAFAQTKLTEITIPKTVNRLGNGVFSLSKLEKVTFEEGSALRSVASNAFSDNVGLKEIDLPETVEKIEANAFSNCGFKTILFSQNENLKILEEEAFFGNPLELVFIPNTVMFIGEDALTAKNSDEFTTRLVFEKGVSRSLIDGLQAEAFESGAIVREIYDNTLVLLESERVYYAQLADETATAVYAETQNEVKIGSSVLGVRVKAVGAQLLSARDATVGVSTPIDSVRIDTGVARIETEAFVSCGASQAKNVYVPIGVEYVGKNIGGDYIRLSDREVTTAYADGWDGASKGVAFGYNGYKTTEGGVEYTLDDKGAIVLRVKPNAVANRYGVVDIPELIEGRSVYKMTEYACTDKMIVSVHRNVVNVANEAIGEQCTVLYEGEALSDTARSIGGFDGYGETESYTYVFTTDGKLIVLSYKGTEKTVRLDRITVQDRAVEVVGFIDYAFGESVEEVFYRQGIKLYGESDSRYHEYLA